jgi:hypothetical protein
VSIDELNKYLKENLKLEHRKTSEYIGWYNDQLNTKDVDKIELILSGKVISEVTLN